MNGKDILQLQINRRACNIIDLQFTLSALVCQAHFAFYHFAEFPSNKSLPGRVNSKPEQSFSAYRLFSEILQNGVYKLLFRLQPF